MGCRLCSEPTGLFSQPIWSISTSSSIKIAHVVVGERAFLLTGRKQTIKITIVKQEPETHIFKGCSYLLESQFLLVWEGIKRMVPSNLKFQAWFYKVSAPFPVSLNVCVVPPLSWRNKQAWRTSYFTRSWKNSLCAIVILFGGAMASFQAQSQSLNWW